MIWTWAKWRRRFPAAVVGFAAFTAMLCHADELPPEIQADRYLVRAERQIQAGDSTAAVATLDKILVLQKDHGLGIPAAFWFKHAQASLDAKQFEKAATSATRYLSEAGRDGEHYLAALEILDASEQELEAQSHREAEKREREAEVRKLNAKLRAEERASGGYGPEMVVIPAGSFRMGCVSNDDDCDDAEKPTRRVTIPQAFAVSKYEVTFDEWDLCAVRGGCGGFRPRDKGWGRGNRPVINVSWKNAKDYVAWLSSETGAQYRLLSEAEWEYAARAGSMGKYSGGAGVGSNQANCDGCGDGWGDKWTAPVGWFAANAFGLHDMHGNVWEWTEDCWNENYAGAPSDGSAWTSGNCARRVLRGGPWIYFARNYRSGNRVRAFTNDRFTLVGFRVARTLTP